MLKDVEVNTINKATTGVMFSRASLTAYDSYDLGTGMIDTPGAVQRATNVTPRRSRYDR
jgi:hypothetical protein